MAAQAPDVAGSPARGGPAAKAGSAGGEAEVERVPGRRLMSLLCLVGALEGADGVLLPCVFYALQLDLGLSLNQLVLLGLVQGLAGNVAAPVWGALADRGGLRRKTIIVGGCVAQGCITMALAAVDGMVPMVFLRAVNGMMLASLRPIATAVLAEVTSESRRGEVFGRMGFMMNMGTMCGSFVGTNLATKVIGGVQGWRVAFLIIGAASVSVGLAAGVAMVEPPRAAATRAASRTASWELRQLLGYFRTPTFCVVVSQGLFAVLSWIAICGYGSLFFQVAGLTPLQTSLVGVCSVISSSIGVLVGGVVSDRLTRCSRYHGRPLAAQISVLSGIPVAWLLFGVQPPHDGAFVYYTALMVALGLMATWCYFAVNAPILAEIVEPDCRTSIMAWEGTLSSTFSTIFGNALVAFLADMFGYNLKQAQGATAEENAKNITALGNALMAVSVFPFMLCFLCYTLLHWTYPRDMRRLLQQRQQREKCEEEEEPPSVDELNEEPSDVQLEVHAAEKADALCPEKGAGAIRPRLADAAAEAALASVTVHVDPVLLEPGVAERPV